MDNIMATLQEYYGYMYSIYGNSLMGVFLYGSQNYGIQTSNSDIDAKAIIIPSLINIAALKKPISKEYHYNDAHIEVKDIRLMIEMFYKQNMNFLEILFTDYYLINPEYKTDWETILSYRDKLAYFDERQTFISASHQALHTIRQDRLTGKQIANAWRMSDFLEKYQRRFDYKECMEVSSWKKREILDYKKTDIIFSKNEEIVQSLDDSFDWFIYYANKNKDLLNSRMDLSIKDEMNLIKKNLILKYETLLNK